MGQLALGHLLGPHLHLLRLGELAALLGDSLHYLVAGVGCGHDGPLDDGLLPVDVLRNLGRYILKLFHFPIGLYSNRSSKEILRFFI
jgi:hypothetical protein